MIGSLHPDEVEDFLFFHHVGHLACIAEGKPYVVPITYAYHGDALYGQTVPGRKVSALRVQPEICFSVAGHADPYTWHSVVAEGVFAEVTEPAERTTARALLARVAPMPHAGGGSVVFRLHLITKSGRWLRSEHPNRVAPPG